MYILRENMKPVILAFEDAEMETLFCHFVQQKYNIPERNNLLKKMKLDI